MKNSDLLNSPTINISEKLSLFEKYMYAKHNFGQIGTKLGEFWNMGVVAFLRSKWILHECDWNLTIPRQYKNDKELAKFNEGLNDAKKEWKYFNKKTVGDIKKEIEHEF